MCDLCSLYVNGLRVLDVYNSRAGAWLAPPPSVTNCVSLGGGLGLHELVLRFAAENASSSSTRLSVGWLPCDNSTEGRPLGPLLMNNLLWRPSSGVAGE